MQWRFRDRKTDFHSQHEQIGSVSEQQQPISDSSLKSCEHNGASDPMRTLTATPRNSGSRGIVKEASAVIVKESAVEGQQVFATTLSDIEQTVRVNESLLRDLLESLQMLTVELKAASTEKDDQIAALSTEQTTLLRTHMDTHVAQFIDSRIARMEQSMIARMEQSMNQEFTKLSINLSLARQQRFEALSHVLPKPEVAKTHTTGRMVEVEIAGDELAEEGAAKQHSSLANPCSELAHAATEAAEGLHVNEGPSEHSHVVVSPLGMKVQKTRLARHAEKLVKAEESQDTSVMIRNYLRKHIQSQTVVGTVTAATIGTSSTLADQFVGCPTQRAGVLVVDNRLECCFGRSDRLEGIVESYWFGWLTVFAIASNSIWMALASNWHMKESVRGRHARPSTFVAIDKAFAIVFAIEIMLRIATYRCAFFLDLDWRYNLFDLVVVVMGFLDDMLSVGFNSSVFRVVRILRLLRMFKVIRSLSAFTELQQLLCAVMNCMGTFFWTLIIFSFVSFMCTVVCMELLLGLDEHDDAVMATKAKWFSSFFTSMETVIMIASFGVTWRDVVEPVNGALLVVIMFYVLFVMFLVIPIIIGTHAMRVTNFQKYEPYVCIQRKIKDAMTFIKGLEARVRAQGYKMNDRVSREELVCIMDDPDTEKFLLAHELEFQISDVFDLFDLDGKGAITVTQFVYGCHFLTVSANATDPFFMSEHLNKIEELLTFTKDRVRTIERVVTKASKAQTPVETHV